MTLFTNINQNENVEWSEVELALNDFAQGKISTLCLEQANNHYIQCAGRADRLTIEYRMTTNEAFKHFILGKGRNKSPLKVTWTVVETTSGNLRRHLDEVLTIEDGQISFKHFFEHKTIKDTYRLRNITNFFS